MLKSRDILSCFLFSITFWAYSVAQAQVEVVEYYESGSIQTKGTLNENNLEIGKWERFYENGVTQYIVF